MVKFTGLKSRLSALKLIKAIDRSIVPIFKRQKLPGLVIVPLTLIALLGVAGLLNSQIHDLELEVMNRGALIAGQFPENDAANWLARSRSSRSDWQIEPLFKLKAIIKSIAENPFVTYSLIADDKNSIIKAHTTESLTGTPYVPVSGEEIADVSAGMSVLKYRDNSSGTSMVDFASPVYYGKGETRLRIGTFHFGLPMEEVERASRRKKILLPSFSVVFILLAFAFIIVRDRVEQKKKVQIATDKNRIGPYILEKKIATGGMGELFLARKEIGQFKMRVAVKRILSERADDKDYISSLLDEANLASQLNHPNIATLHDFGNIQETYFIAMEYIDGENLLRIMDVSRGDIPVGLIIYIIGEVCKGLDYAHNKADDFSGQPLNIVHRDVSPQNILVSAGGEVKIVDFGIARAAQRQSKKTTVGIVKGKLHYMSPEQASAGGELDKRSDIFSLGLLLYELLAGKKVYQGETSQEVLRLACEAKVASISSVRPDIPGDLCTIVMKALEPDPSERYQTAGKMYEDFVQFIKNNPDYRRSKTDLAKFMEEKFKYNEDTV